MTDFDPSATPDDLFWKRLERVVRAFVLKIAGRYRIPHQDWDDVAQIALIGLYRAFRERRDEIDEPEAYARKVVRRACIGFLARRNPQEARLRDAVLDTLNGKRGIGGLEVWTLNGRRIGGLEGWRGRRAHDTDELRALLRDPQELRRAADVAGVGVDVPRLVVLVLQRVRAPVAVSDFVTVISGVMGIDRARDVSLDDPVSGGTTSLDVPSHQASPEEAIIRATQMKEKVAAYALAMVGLSRQRLGGVLFGMESDALSAIEWACGEPQTWVREFDAWLQRHLAERDLEEIRRSSVLLAALIRLYSRRLELRVRRLRSVLTHVPLADARIASWLASNVTAVRVSRHEARKRLRMIVRELLCDTAA